MTARGDAGAAPPGDAIGLCLEGAISPEVALARLMLGGAGAAGIQAMLQARRAASPRWQALAALLERRRGAVDRLAGEIARDSGDHAALDPQGGVARIAAFFDRAVDHSPEASVALYSLGDPAILAAATAEIVAWLLARGLLGGRADVLDLGCGVGRVAAALAPSCRSVLGLDVSPKMVAEARRRCAGIEGLRFEATGGRDLDGLPPASLDLVLAVDSFPYVIQAGEGVAERHVAGAARALRGGGALVLLNLSYGRDLAADRADAAAWAGRHGFAVEADGDRPFAIWDAVAFVLRRPAGAAGPA